MEVYFYTYDCLCFLMVPVEAYVILFAFILFCFILYYTFTCYWGDGRFRLHVTVDTANIFKLRRYKMMYCVTCKCHN